MTALLCASPACALPGIHLADPGPERDDSKPRTTLGSQPMPAELLELAPVPLAELLKRDPDDMLTDVMRRLFDPDEQGPATIAAFNSSL